jgi:hypothetical protein
MWVFVPTNNTFKDRDDGMWAWFSAANGGEWFFYAGESYWHTVRNEWVQDWEVWSINNVNGKGGKGAEQEWFHLQRRTESFFF